MNTKVSNIIAVELGIVIVLTAIVLIQRPERGARGEVTLVEPME